MSHIYNEFEFDPKATTVSTPVLKLLEERKGVCQDFAHLMLACLRSHGLAARYVSGYLLTKPPPGKPRMVGADASHAWVSVYCPSAGGEFWIDFDPTNNLMPDTEPVSYTHLDVYKRQIQSLECIPHGGRPGQNTVGRRRH